MIGLPKLTEVDVSGKKVLVRVDIDLGDEILESDTDKLLTQKETLDFLIGKGGKTVLIGHRGRPQGKKDENLSLGVVAEKLSEIIGKKVDFVREIFGKESQRVIEGLGNGEVVMLENLRFDAREESNDPEFAKQLAALGEAYVNEAFSASHRNHASIVSVPKYLRHAAGFHMMKEVENLSRVLDNPKKPVVVIISGVKKDKLDYLDDFKKFADKVLVAGRLPEYLQDTEKDNKLLIAGLIQDKEDITMHSIEKFEAAINSAGTVVVSGPVGKYEDEGHRQGTQRVFSAVANSSAFKVAGGGDTEQAIKLLGLADKFDWISVGGGASLEFLAKGTLPGIEALRVKHED